MNAGVMIIDAIRLSPIPVSTIVSGEAASMGLIIAMSGKKGERFVTSNSTVMSHTFSCGMEGNEHELRNSVKSLAMASEKMVRLYKQATGKSEAYIRRNFVGSLDTFFTAEEAVKHGMFDAVIKLDKS